MYAGDFLEEDVYQDWATGLREEARAVYVRVARALAERAGTAGDHDACSGYLLRILQRDAYDERAHLALVTALVRGGAHGEARRAYRAYPRGWRSWASSPPRPFDGRPRAPGLRLAESDSKAGRRRSGTLHVETANTGSHRTKGESS